MWLWLIAEGPIRLLYVAKPNEQYSTVNTPNRTYSAYMYVCSRHRPWDR